MLVLIAQQTGVPYATFLDPKGGKLSHRQAETLKAEGFLPKDPVKFYRPLLTICPGDCIMLSGQDEPYGLRLVGRDLGEGTVGSITSPALGTLRTVRFGLVPENEQPLLKMQIVEMLRKMGSGFAYPTFLTNSPKTIQHSLFPNQ